MVAAVVDGAAEGGRPRPSSAGWRRGRCLRRPTTEMGMVPGMAMVPAMGMAPDIAQDIALDIALDIAPGMPPAIEGEIFKLSNAVKAGVNPGLFLASARQPSPPRLSAFVRQRRRSPSLSL
jgi:hypothetical protein